jgi:hypothetical protein
MATGGEMITKETPVTQDLQVHQDRGNPVMEALAVVAIQARMMRTKIIH